MYFFFKSIQKYFKNVLLNVFKINFKCIQIYFKCIQKYILNVKLHQVLEQITIVHTNIHCLFESKKTYTFLDLLITINNIILFNNKV